VCNGWMSQIDLDELVELVDLPDSLFQWSLDIETGELYPGPDDTAHHLVELPQLNESQIQEWMSRFATQATLKHPAPKVRFREVLSVNPQAQNEWSNYFDRKRREILVDWLKSLSLE